MSKVENLREPVAECANPECREEILYRQPVVQCGDDLYCGNECLFAGIGANVVRAGCDPSNENDPTD